MAVILTLPYKTKQFLLALIKLSIVVGAFYLIYRKLAMNDALDLRDFKDFLYQNNLFSFQNIFFLLILSTFNWFLEILKWQNLVSFISSISFKNATEQSLSALTVSLLTPNRIGDYGAKAMYYPKPIRKKIMLLNLIGNMMQMSVTIIFGIIGLLFFVFYYSLELDYFKISIVLILMLAFLLLVRYSLKKGRFEVKGFSLPKIFKFLQTISAEIGLKTMIYSIFRYLVFSFQFYFLLQIFGVTIDYFTAMMVITTMYLLSSVIPSIFIFDVVIKGSVAVYLFSMLGVNDWTILYIVTLMWLLNFVVPSIIGSYYVLNFNLSKLKQTT